MTRLILIADDLTGALDSGVAFAERGASVRIAVHPDGLQGALEAAPDVVGVVTGTRERSKNDAKQILSTIGKSIKPLNLLIFKKIDSRLKGHIEAEIKALSAQCPLFICPAIPRLGRRVHNGAVIGHGISDPIDIAQVITGTIPNVDTDTELDDALPQELETFTYVGAAGLAEALARRLWPRGSNTYCAAFPEPALFAIGSRDPVTVEQVGNLNRSIKVHTAPNGISSPAPEAPITILQMVQGLPKVSPDEASQSFAATLASQIETQRPATLFACGGESAQTIFDQLGIQQLDIMGEALPGVPVARATDGDGLVVVTKSGGFGAPDTIAKLVQKVVNHKQI